MFDSTRSASGVSWHTTVRLGLFNKQGFDFASPCYVRAHDVTSGIHFAHMADFFDMPSQCANRLNNENTVLNSLLYPIVPIQSFPWILTGPGFVIPAAYLTWHVLYTAMVYHFCEKRSLAIPCQCILRWLVTCIVMAPGYSLLFCYGYTIFCVQSGQKLYILMCINIELVSGTNRVETNRVPTLLRFSQVKTE